MNVASRSCKTGGEWRQLASPQVVLESHFSSVVSLENYLKPKPCGPSSENPHCG